MTRQKDLKKKTRARMSKTGESYTAARARLLAKKAAGAPQPLRAETPPSDFASLAGMSDAAVRAKTGCDWKQWVGALDYAGAADWSHRAIAEHVAEKYRLSGWWAQTVTVGYERIKGLREVGQRRSGAFEANKSRTFAVPVAELFAAWADGRRRKRWLPEAGLKVRKATPDRSMRITWPDGTSVELWFVAKGEAKSTVQVQHTKLAGREEAERRKAYWAERLHALAGLLQTAS
jgi:uncharacterized protein YndB with AHSA1/START domain